jgi:TPP-dependent pyruvate/acetoin dehydrogenase alpha subunit
MLLELETYRFAGHSRSDPGHYRPKEEVAAWKQRDPIALYERALLSEKALTEGEVSEMKSAIEHELDEAVQFAKESPNPKPEDCLADIYAD